MKKSIFYFLFLIFNFFSKAYKSLKELLDPAVEGHPYRSSRFRKIYRVNYFGYKKGF